MTLIMRKLFRRELLCFSGLASVCWKTIQKRNFSEAKGIFQNCNQARWSLNIVPRRHASSTRTHDDTVLCQTLTSRGVVRIAGADVDSFLQGLITNDMSMFAGDEENPCRDVMYALMLNVQGRVLYDLILYYLRNETPSTYLVECDLEVIPEFIKLMKRYKIRKKVDITDVSAEYSLWAAFPDSIDQTTSPNVNTTELQKLNGICVPDPRLSQLGHRLIIPGGNDAGTVIENGRGKEGFNSYMERRYMLGVGEGVVDMPPGGALPLESNAVFLNGVSFNKGCYIGQELTARTHHTGVIRKRLMPLVLPSELHDCAPGDSITNSANANCGKFRSSIGRSGLGLLRIPNVVGKGTLSVQRKEGEDKDAPTTIVGEAETFIPDWWPKDSDAIIKQVEAAVNA